MVSNIRRDKHYIKFPEIKKKKNNSAKNSLLILLRYLRLSQTRVLYTFSQLRSSAKTPKH